jgi:AcrR family transcriptional regulator
MPALRRDAARNRDLILDAARSLCASGQALQLNAVAHAAGVGVGTVYRHFPSTGALAEELVAHQFVELTDAARAALDEPDEFEAIRSFLARSLRFYVSDIAFADAVVTTVAAREETEALRAELFTAFAALLSRAAHHFRDDLDHVDIMILLCGVGYSARLAPTRAEAYLDALLDGIVAPSPPAP